MAGQSKSIVQSIRKLSSNSGPSRPGLFSRHSVQNPLSEVLPTRFTNPSPLNCKTSGSPHAHAGSVGRSVENVPFGFSRSGLLVPDFPLKLPPAHGVSSKPMLNTGFFPRFFSTSPRSCGNCLGGSAKNIASGLYPSGSSSSRVLIAKFSSESPSSVTRTWASLHGNVGLNRTIKNLFGARFYSMRTPAPVKFDSNAVKKLVFEKPVSAVTSMFARYREAMGLHVEAFWKRYSLVLVGAAGVGLCLLLWRIMFGLANTFIGFSEGMAKYGFLALATAMVSFLGIYIRSRFTLNPDKIYRIAMRKLNTSAAVLEVMGAPLSGTDVRAYVMSGGGPRLKNFKLRLAGKRCFLIFPVRGSERKGLVSVEAKKKKGQYDIKLLAVDIPMISGPDQRLFLIGDDKEYRIGGGLISELRDPIVKAMAAEKEFDDLDEKEEEEDAERERCEAERRHREEIEKLEKDSS